MCVFFHLDHSYFILLQPTHFNGCHSELDPEGMCWPATQSDEMAFVPCYPYPWHLLQENTTGIAIKYIRMLICLCITDGIYACYHLQISQCNKK